MSYECVLYRNTGFNAINIPDSPALLTRVGNPVTVPALEILQEYFLTSIQVKSGWEGVKECDYCKVGSFFYSVTSVTMLTVGTAQLSLVPDFVTSAGGPAKLHYIDGITSRATVSDDTYGAYTDPDPLTAPQRPLKIVTEWDTATGSGDIPSTIDGDPVFVESTISLPQQGYFTDGETYTDANTGETVTIPKTYPITGSKFPITVEGNDQDDVTDFVVDGSAVSDRTAVYVENDKLTSDFSGVSNITNVGQAVMDGLSAVRALGIEEGSILNQWRVPKEFVGSIKQNTPGTYFTTGTDKAATFAGIKSIAGRKATISTNIKPDYATVKNKRTLYGDYNKYGLMTTAGNSAEFKPEEITTEKESPEVTFISDPRPQGKPYFRFTTINGNKEFWRNCVAGSEWQNVPLVYQGASGTALTRLNFDNSRAMTDLQANQWADRYKLNGVESIVNTVFGTGTQAAQLAMSGASGGLSDMVGAGMSGGTSGGVAGLLFTIAHAEQDYKQYAGIYKQQKANELSQLYQATTVYAPTVNFPYNADILRDVKGNAILLYKYELQDEDVKRVDKLLTMYGYKETEPVTADIFDRRQKFDYVECSAVTVTGLPKWWCDGIGAQLTNGVRVWHTKPSADAYTDNPIKEA